MGPGPPKPHALCQCSFPVLSIGCFAIGHGVEGGAWASVHQASSVPRACLAGSSLRGLPSRPFVAILTQSITVPSAQAGGAGPREPGVLAGVLVRGSCGWLLCITSVGPFMAIGTLGGRAYGHPLLGEQGPLGGQVCTSGCPPASGQQQALWTLLFPSSPCIPCA